MSTTALARITAAFELLQVFQPGESLPAADAQTAFRALNDMLGGWQLELLTAPVNLREVFPLVAGQGGPDTPYTIGPGGDFDTTRPPTTECLNGAAVLLGTTGVEIPRALLDDDQYRGIQIKGLASGLATWVYYNPTYAGGLGTMQLYPVPNVSTDHLVLYRQQFLDRFVSLAASYDLPEGYAEAIDYNLARRLKGRYGKVMDPDDLQIAASSLARLKIANVQLGDLAVDPMWIGSNPRGGYNIVTGR